MLLFFPDFKQEPKLNKRHSDFGVSYSKEPKTRQRKSVLVIPEKGEPVRCVNHNNNISSENSNLEDSVFVSKNTGKDRLLKKCSPEPAMKKRKIMNESKLLSLTCVMHRVSFDKFGHLLFIVIIIYH